MRHHLVIIFFVLFSQLNAQPVAVLRQDAGLDPFTLHEFQLRAGDMLYALTDGFADQFGGLKGKKFKYAQLKEKIMTIHHSELGDQKSKLDRMFEKWRGKLEQVDDVCIIGIRI